MDFSFFPLTLTLSPAFAEAASRRQALGEREFKRECPYRLPPS
jgi:hypothetical protein